MADTHPMNGNYPAYPDYTHANAVHSAANFQPTQSSTPTNVAPVDQKIEHSKDEVGWFFVEQYYTTLSRDPKKLHLFYSRRSQFVFGTEAESVPVAIGQKDINDKIHQLEFQDCKVRVLNVDSQASFDNILITVIGEISNKSEPSRKFVQTFVLAEQPNGYYVLNDIFRYLVDEDDEVVNEQTAPAVVEEQAPPAPVEVAPEVAPAQVESQVTNEPAATKVDEKLEQAEANGEVVEPTEAQTQVNGKATQPEEPVSEVPVEAPAAKTEKPLAPEPSPVSPASKVVTTASPEKGNVAPAPAVPKTWANIASKTGAAAPVVPAVPVATPKPALAASSPQQASTSAAAAAPENAPTQPASNDTSGWQTAGHDHKKRSGEEQSAHAYVKGVTDKMDANVLKQTLSRYGRLIHFDVSRPKNCAFVEFANAAGYAAAVAANPLQVGGEQVSVEERRMRSQNVPGGRGGGAGRGRAGNHGRGGFQRDGGRGGFGTRGRGGNAGPKGRQAQAA